MVEQPTLKRILSIYQQLMLTEKSEIVMDIEDYHVLVFEFVLIKQGNHKFFTVHCKVFIQNGLFHKGVNAYGNWGKSLSHFFFVPSHYSIQMKLENLDANTTGIICRICTTFQTQ